MSFRLRTMKNFSLAKKLVFAALFATLCAVGTLVITIPLPFGYFNLGDAFVLLAAWLLGPIYGAAAAAVGCALADIIAGFSIYAPATFLIKGLDAVLAYFVLRALCKPMQKTKWLACAIAAFVGELLMVFGYFLFECCLYGLAGGVATLIGNGLQGGVSVLLSVSLYTLLSRNKTIRNTFID